MKQNVNYSISPCGFGRLYFDPCSLDSYTFISILVQRREVETAFVSIFSSQSLVLTAIVLASNVDFFSFEAGDDCVVVEMEVRT
ncbi:hypothetical protein RHGRI_011691 [Rhododendron griersonianum]|uniref:Uncharacterized protein n=1 Tax=Rhododendron griersonianum TaxID=479676 RepID=A0AAV6KN91_9ERIC|nr:hypothetical protein RHGRI_011691 [Rhododendron griersonianum]